MPKKPKAGSDEKVHELEATAENIETLRAFVRSSEGMRFLDDPNITSIGIGFKRVGGEEKSHLCIQFAVGQKAPEPELEALHTEMVPEVIEFKGLRIPTDVIQRTYRPGYELLEELEAKDKRKQRLETMVPGVSVSNPRGTAGTLGVIVYDNLSGQPCVLSNWHVLHTPKGEIGDPIVQPGPYDDNRIDDNRAGVLVRSHLGLAGDCAIARIEGRGFDPTVLELNKRPARLARPNLGDRVVKSGRTTAVTYGRVTRVDTVTKIRYGGSTGEERIGGFEIGPDPEHPAVDGEISMGGDSGSAWLIADKEGASDILVGLHFAGEGDDDPNEHALACYAHAVFKKLEISLTAPEVQAASEAVAGRGYDSGFLGSQIPVPVLEDAISADVVLFQNQPVIPYTHFSVCLSRSRRLARFVAWNIDGGQLKAYGRTGLRFKLDPRVDAALQVGDELYGDNRLDRGHVARRADLVWGPKAEAQQANKDSFYFTNITPQHEAFNQSSQAGLWGQLEDAIFEDVEVNELRVTLFGGPILKRTDPVYRDVRIPRSFWKLAAYVDAGDGQLKVRAYVLSQDNLLDKIEALELDPFRMYQVSLEKLAEITSLRFANALRKADTLGGAGPEAVGAGAREITKRAELLG